MRDCIGQEVKEGDTIVYFTRRGSSMYSQVAKIEMLPDYLSTNRYSPSILVLRADAVEKNRFTRKAWLWSLDNAVRISSPEEQALKLKAYKSFTDGVETLMANPDALYGVPVQ